MTVFLYLFGGGVINLLLGGLVRLLWGSRRLAFRVCRCVAAVFTGLSLTLIICAFLFADADEDGRGAGMMAVAAIGLLIASLSCWPAAWVFRDPVAPPSESNPGLNREGPQQSNS